MPRFFFHVRDGVELPDTDGLDLISLKEARVEALKYAGHVIADQAQDTYPDQMWAMDVVDELGVMVLRLEFAIMKPQAGDWSS